MTPKNRTRILLHLAAGAAVAFTAILFDYILALPPRWGSQQTLMLSAGIIIAVAGLPRVPFFSRLSTNLSLSLITVFLLIAASEGAFRLIGHDFAHEERAWRQIPPYYRQPTVPTGEVFFRRPGPDTWTGQVRSAFLVQERFLSQPYADEPVITVNYNQHGFRNPEDLTDWALAIAGDSFTELGHLPNEQIFTTLLNEQLGVDVLNLGASYTGPLTHLSYLREYGVAPSTQHAMIIFFEGNDLKDLALEHEALTHWQETGQRDYRDFQRQPSVIRHLHARIDGLVEGTRSTEPNSRINAHFKGADGDTSIRINYVPPSPDELSAQTLEQIDFFFREYARFGNESQLTLWLAYMPSKLRIFQPHIELSESAKEELHTWQPTDLARLIAEKCDQHGILFADLTHVLTEATKQQRIPLYNPIDTHINAAGAQIVADELAGHLAARLNRRSATANPAR